MLGILKLLLHKYSCGKAGSLPACAVLAFVRGALCGGKDKHNITRSWLLEPSTANNASGTSNRRLREDGNWNVHTRMRFVPQLFDDVFKQVQLGEQATH